MYNSIVKIALIKITIISIIIKLEPNDLYLYNAKLFVVWTSGVMFIGLFCLYLMMHFMDFLCY